MRLTIMKWKYITLYYGHALALYEISKLRRDESDSKKEKVGRSSRGHSFPNFECRIMELRLG